MIGWNAAAEFDSDDLVDQVRQALENVKTVLAEAGATPEHMVRMTWYVTDRADYLARNREIGAAYRDVMGHYDVAMSAVEVRALMEARAKVEIEVTAVVPQAL
jgi:enamine deaminase RidA (YjgF/YER057c/UK114 family)